jgi:hypothetical protein
VISLGNCLSRGSSTMIEQSKSDSCVLLANIEPISIPASFLKFCPVAFQPVGLPLDATDLRRVESCARSPERARATPSMPIQPLQRLLTSATAASAGHSRPETNCTPGQPPNRTHGIEPGRFCPLFSQAGTFRLSVLFGFKLVLPVGNAPTFGPHLGQSSL